MHLALFTPSGPPDSPLIRYQAAIAPLLLRRHRLTLVMASPQENEAKQTRALFPEEVAVRSYAEFCQGGACCDLALYPFGERNRLNGFIYEAARRTPGIAVLHDAILHQGLLHDPALQEDAAYACRELVAVYGALGQELAARVLDGQVREVFRHYSPLPEVLGGHLALVVPSEVVTAELVARPPGLPLRYIPPPAPQQAIAPQSRKALGLDGAPLIVVPAPPETEGDILLLRMALQALWRAFPAVRTMVWDHGRLSANPAWGNNGPPERLWRLNRLSPSRCDALAAEADVAILFASEEGALDPTLVVRLLALGTPLVVVDPMQLQPSLRRVVAPVWRDKAQPWAALRAALHYVLSDLYAAQEMAAAGRRLVAQEHHPEAVLWAWEKTLTEAAARRFGFRATRLDDLSGRTALSSLAGRALAELGVTSRDRALFSPFASIIASLAPERIAELPCLDSDRLS